MRLIITVFLLLTITYCGMAQDGRFEKLYVTPGISVGFTFGATFNIGANLDLTTSITNDFDKVQRSGISLGHYLVLSKGGFRPHHISHVNLMFENDYMDIKAGYGLLTYRWGRAQVNKLGQGSFTFDVSFTQRDANIPWFGVKSVFYNQREWIWFDIPYFSVYTRQKFYLTGGN